MKQNIQHYFQLSLAGCRLARQELKRMLGHYSLKDTWWSHSQLGKERHVKVYLLSEILATRF